MDMGSVDLGHEHEDDPVAAQQSLTRSIGIEIQNNLVVQFIGRGTNIPIQVTKGGFSSDDQSTFVFLNVFLGEGHHTYDNEPIGTLEVGPMKPRPAGIHQFEVTFAIDPYGELTTIVKHVNDRKSYKSNFALTLEVKSEGTSEPQDTDLEPRLSNTSTDGQRGVRPNAHHPDHVPLLPTAMRRRMLPNERAISQTLASVTESTKVQAHVTRPEDADVSPTPPLNSDYIVTQAADVPDQFKSLVRRARKSLSKELNPILLRALNRFTTAVNDGVTGDELYELGDDLIDKYHQCQ